MRSKYCGIKQMFCIPPRFVPESSRAANFVFTLWVYWSLLPVGWGCLLLYKMLSAVCILCLWMSKSSRAHVSLHECVHISHFRKSNRIGGMVRVRSMICIRNMLIWLLHRHTDCSPCFGLVINNLFEDFVNRCQDNKTQHRPLHSQHPPPIHLPFFSLINMEMSHSLLLVGKKAVMSLVTGSMDVFGLQGLLFSESMSYHCLGSESKM